MFLKSVFIFNWVCIFLNKNNNYDKYLILGKMCKFQDGQI